MSLTKKEKKKYDVIKDIIEGKITKKEAEFSLGLTRRQINRLILKLNKEGISAFSHKNKGNLYNKKLSIDIENEIIDLYITDYYDYNFLHFYEEINSKYKLSFSSLVAILKKADIISPEAQHKTVKIYNNETKKASNEGNANDKQILLFEER